MKVTELTGHILYTKCILLHFQLTFVSSSSYQSSYFFILSKF